ncbi:winged helix-turn-helix transcriptional regulator [Sanyastnella coralliicola]|uniref:winged helix-turn-helix transcriptional regulator n=1 Tax=Sanyastnella coralliicola TaxID=3069118 RepID=UPI0027B8B2B7|nr:helix-turn-helix domain-containing protein [Longitalea sp. SCSIO 12813]
MKECKNPLCPLQQALQVVGGKWKPVIIYQLSRSKKRFGQLNAAVVGVSRKVLTSQLNELVDDGLVVRTSYAETPPRVEYELTEKGKELLPIFDSMADWGMYLVEDYKRSIAC